jgi:hypothetical protein
VLAGFTVFFIKLDKTGNIYPEFLKEIMNFFLKEKLKDF